MKHWIFSGSLLLIGVLHQPSRAAEIENLPLTQQFYQVEVVLFERLDVTDQNTPEELILHQQRSYPADLLAFRTDDERLAEIYRLTPETQAQLNLTLVTPQADNFEDLETAQTPGQAGSNSGGETLPPMQPREDQKTPESLARQALLDWERMQLEGSFTLLPASRGKLKGAADRLARSRNYRLVDHLLWVQPVPPRNQPRRILIQQGEHQNDLWAFEGYLSITLGRYLHFATTLWYNPFEDPVQAWQFPISASGYVSDSANSGKQPENGFMQLRENRRLRSKTLHYIDHPKFGLLVQIEAVEPPEDLVSQWQIVQEHTQQ